MTSYRMTKYMKKQLVRDIRACEDLKLLVKKYKGEFGDLRNTQITNTIADEEDFLSA